MATGKWKNKILLCAFLTTTLSVGGVYATWQFYEAPPPPTHTSVGININEFTWSPEEVLPDKIDIGESHLDLIRNIIEDTSYGLNKPNSVINKEIAERLQDGMDWLESTATVQGGHLKHIFTTQASQQLEFVLHYVSASLYYIYTFSDEALEKAGTTGVMIMTFRTNCELQDGVWVAVSSEAGQAKTIKDVKGKALTIDVDTWEKV